MADEPTGNLDEATGKQIVDLLFAKHAERGMTLVLVTHDTALAHRCDRVVRLRSGRIDDATGRIANDRFIDRALPYPSIRAAPQRSRSATPCANCAAACAAFTFSSPASRSA